MSSTLAIFALAATLAAEDSPAPIGNEPSPLVLVLGEHETVRRFQPLDPATFGEDGQRKLDYDFMLTETAGLSRRKVEADEPDGPVIPMGLGHAVDDGRPCVVLEMDRPQGKAAIRKGEGFALRFRTVEPDQLRATFGPGVYEGLAWLRFLQRNPGDPLAGERRHLLRLRLVVPGRRVVRLSLMGKASVGCRLKVNATVEEVLKEMSEIATNATPGDRLRIDLIPEGEPVARLDLPWPVPAGAWDPRNPGQHGERDDWAFPTPWLDEPLLVDDPGSKTETTIDGGTARSQVVRQSLRLPPLFAPGTLTAKLGPAGVDTGRTFETMIHSGLIVGPTLAFLNDRISIRAVFARGELGSAQLPDRIKVHIDPPSGPGKTFALLRDSRTTGHAAYLLDPKNSPRLLAPGYYKVTPATSDPAIDQALGSQAVVLAALEKDDSAARRERVAFLGATPIHWPLIVWLDSGRKDGSAHRAETRGALAMRAVRGPEEIDAISLRLSQISVPSRQRPHDNDKDGEIRFAGPGKTVNGPWAVDRQGITLDLTADIGAALRKQSRLVRGPRERYVRFLIEGVGPDRERIGRIFREPCSYKIAGQMEYYQEWAWLPGLIVLAGLVWWYIRRVGGGKKRASKKAPVSAETARPSPAPAGKGRFGHAWIEPERPTESSVSPEPPRRRLPDDAGPRPDGGKRRF